MSAQNDIRRNWRGGKWISPATRLAIYLRDGLSCVWCGRGIETVDDNGTGESIRLSLDHVVPQVHGGDDKPTNLVTACCLCNSTRGDRSIEAFAEACAMYFGRNAVEILDDVLYRALQPLPIGEAEEIVRRRERERGARRRQEARAITVQHEKTSDNT